MFALFVLVAAAVVDGIAIAAAATDSLFGQVLKCLDKLALFLGPGGIASRSGSGTGRTRVILSPVFFGWVMVIIVLAKR